MDRATRQACEALKVENHQFFYVFLTFSMQSKSAVAVHQNLLGTDLRENEATF